MIDPALHEYMILTPDFDYYIEVCHASSPDLAHFYTTPVRGGLPGGVPTASIYGFAPMSAVDYARCMRLGRQEADAELARRGAAVLDPLPLGRLGLHCQGQLLQWELLLWFGCWVSALVTTRLENEFNPSRYANSG